MYECIHHIDSTYYGYTSKHWAIKKAGYLSVKPRHSLPPVDYIILTAFKVGTLMWNVLMCILYIIYLLRYTNSQGHTYALNCSYPHSDKHVNIYIR